MNLMDKIYTGLESRTKGNPLYQNERLTMLMQKECLPLELLAAGGTQRMRAEAELANVMLPDAQIAVHKAFVSLPVVYGETLKRTLLHSVQAGARGGRQPDLEEGCIRRMTEYAEERFENAGKHLPDGTVIYPVTIHPTDWVEHLDSGFGSIDCMQSSQTYMADYVKVFLSRERTVSVLLRYGGLLGSKDLYANIDRLRQELGDMYPWLGIFQEPDQVPEVTWERLRDEVIPHTAVKYQVDRQELYDNIVQHQERYKRYEEALWDWIRNSTDNSSFLKEMKAELKALQKRLSQLRTQIRLSMLQDGYEPGLGYGLLPHTVDDVYEPIVVTGTIEELYRKSALCCEDTSYVTGLNALFAGNVPYGIEKKNVYGHLGIEIGFLARRLEIERAWFLPNALGKSESTLPVTYPGGLVIVKDITIRFTFDQVSAPAIPVFLKYVHQNSGFLCFHERYQNHRGLCSIGGNVLTCRFGRPRLAGYYTTNLL